MDEDRNYVLYEYNSNCQKVNYKDDFCVNSFSVVLNKNEMNLVSKVGFIFHHITIQAFPECHQRGSVQMAFGS